MRFGFFFFAEYVNVFIISALTVTLFFGGWNAPFPWPWPIELTFDPGSLGIGMLLGVAIIPVVLTLAFAAPIWIASSRIKGWQALIGGFVLANLFIVAVIGAWAYIGLDWVAGLLWFLRQDLHLRVHLRVDARHAAARADRPADGFRLEVDAAGVAPQPVPDRRRDRRRQDREALMSLVPGLGIAKGMALTLRRFFEPKVTIKYPEQRAPVPHKFRGRLQLLYDEWGTIKCETCFQCAQACPIECIDMGGIDTRGRYPRPLGRPRDVRRTTRGIGAAALRPAGPGPRLPAVRRGRPARARRGSSTSTTTTRREMLAILEATQTAYGYLPVAALKRISQRTGAWYAMIYGTATYYSHLRFEPADGQRAGRGRRRATGRPRRPTSPPSTHRSPAHARARRKPARA